MRRLAIVSVAMAIATTVYAPAVMAAPESSALATCVADHTNGKDRKDLARWVFAVMGVHPAIADLSAATPAARDGATGVVGALMTRLIAIDCLKEARATMQDGGGTAAMTEAFRQLGELAMKELMSDPQVAASMADLPRHLDFKKLESALK